MACTARRSSVIFDRKAASCTITVQTMMTGSIHPTCVERPCLDIKKSSLARLVESVASSIFGRLEQNSLDLRLGQITQGSQIDHVQRLAVFGAFFGFQIHRHVAKSFVFENVSEGDGAEVAAADV